MYLNRALYLGLFFTILTTTQSVANAVQDTIPPTFTTPPQNLFISCEDALSIELSAWINSGGFSQADNGDAEVVALSSVNDALNILLQAFGTGCSGTGEVEVGFYAIDDCNNISQDTLYASLSVQDTEGPEFTTEATSVITHCDISIQDTLVAWLDNFGGAMAEDNCSDSIIRSHYTWEDNLGNNGFVDHGDSTDIIILREMCEWSVDVSFFVRDECDNINSTSASFTLDSDTIAPVVMITLPDTTILCDQSIENLAPIFVDDCDGTMDITLLESSSQHIDTLNCGYYDYTIERIWIATDACGNATRDTQIVSVVDTIIPSAILQDDLVIPCGTDLNDISNFISVSDNCSPTEINFMDDIILDNQCQQQIIRTWTIEDVCNNTFITTQTIQVQDFETPIFTVNPSDLTIGCDATNIIDTYRAWLSNNANAQVEDACTSISTYVRLPGNYIDTTEIIEAEPPSLPMPLCDGFDNKIINQEVEVFVFDNCGNIASATASFILIDSVAANIINCPQDTVFTLDTDECRIDYALSYPVVEDNCGLMQDTIWTASVDDNFVFDNSSNSIVELEVGDHIIEYLTEDCGGNISSCRQVITVIDTTSPILICPPSIDLFLTEECSENFIVPEIEDYFDNCFGSNNFSQTQPSNNGFINFSFDSTDSTYQAQDFPVEFNNIVTRGRVFKPQIKIEYALNISLSSTVKIISEFGDILLEITEGQCTPMVEFLQLEENQFNVWAIDMDIKFTVVFENNSGEGTTVCNIDNVSPTDLQDEISYFIITLEYSDVIPEHIIVDSDQNVINNNDPETELDKGEYTLWYSTTDRSNNVGSCSTTINVVDTVAPKITCVDTFLTILPNETGLYDIPADLIIRDTNDNCEINETTYGPEVISCMDAGQTLDIIVTSTDDSNNSSQCISRISIAKDSIEPIFVSGLCLADTLLLFSGVPSDIAQSYNWTGPNGFSSSLSDPILSSIGDENSGIYTLEITTRQGCTYVGEVDIEVSLFDSPEIFSNQSSYCIGDDVLLNSTSFTEIVDYFWYEGISPNGILIGQTDGPSLSITPTVGDHFYYVEVSGDNCNSNPSNTYQIEVIPLPIAEITNPFITICEGDDIVLESSSFSPNYIYEWAGPNDYSSSGQIPVVINNASSVNQGNYTLTIIDNNCVSETVTAQVIVFEPPVRPEISGESVLCEGQSAVLSVNNFTTATRYLWYKDGQLFSTTSTNNLLLPSVSNIDAGLWTVIIEDGICLSEESEEFEIIVESVLNVGASNNGPICEGELVTLTSTFIPDATYQWVGPQGNTFNGREITIQAVNGIYIVNVTTQSNCSATATTEIQIRPQPVVTALSNTSLPCMSGSTPISLIPSIFPAGNYTYQWSGPNNYTSAEEVAIIPNADLNDNGVYTLIVSNGDCVSAAVTNTVNISVIPQVPLLSGDIVACENSNIRIDILNPVNGNANFIWSTPQGSVTTNTPFLDVINVNSQNTGQYTVVQEKDGCRSQPSTPLNLSLLDLPQTPIIQGPTMACEGSSIVITTDLVQNSSYFWSTPNGLISTNEPELIIDAISLSNQGNYQVYTQMGSCTSPLSAILSIEILPQPEAPEFVLSSIAVCNTSNTELIVCIEEYLNDFDMIQLIDNGTGTILAEENSFCFDISFLLNSNQDILTLSAVAVNDNCFSINSIPINIEIANAPIDIYSIDQDTITLCNVEFFNITPDNIIADVTAVWSSPDPDINIFQNLNDNTSFSNLRTGFNTLILESDFSSCGVYGSDTLIVEVIDEIVANDDNFQGDFDQDIIITPLINDLINSEATLSIIMEPIRGDLEIENNILRYIPESGYVGGVEIEYEICYDKCDDLCDLATIFIEIGDNIECFAGNIMTPNNDGQNDNFVVPCLSNNNFRQNSLIIFNQWGDEVFSAAPYENDWAGTYNGNTLPVGTYFYILDLGDGSKPLQGFIIIEL